MHKIHAAQEQVQTRYALARTHMRAHTSRHARAHARAHTHTQAPKGQWLCTPCRNSEKQLQAGGGIGSVSVMQQVPPPPPPPRRADSDLTRM